MSILDLIFPKKCINCKKFGDFLCADCFSKIKYTEGLEFSVGKIDTAISVVSYSPIIKKLIRQFKYKPYVSEVGETIAEIMNEGLSQNEFFYSFVTKYSPVIVPIPLSSKRFCERGYNHSEILGFYVAKYFGLKAISQVLTRTKDTKPQYKLNREERIKNIKDAFDISKNQKVPKSIILIDDLATTYSTLKEAARVLRKNGAKKIMSVAFAREI